MLVVGGWWLVVGFCRCCQRRFSFLFLSAETSFAAQRRLVLCPYESEARINTWREVFSPVYLSRESPQPVPSEVVCLSGDKPICQGEMSLLKVQS